MTITLQQIEDAPMFTVFVGNRAWPGRLLLLHGGRPEYGFFECDGYGADSESEIERRGIPDPQRFSIQSDDETAPDDYDDTDAAISALADGYTLVKVPDSPRSKYWRMYVLDVPRGRYREPVSDALLAVMKTGVIR